MCISGWRICLGGAECATGEQSSRAGNVVRLVEDLFSVTAGQFLMGTLVKDKALKAPLAITWNERDRLVILSVDEYERLKRRDRSSTCRGRALRRRNALVPSVLLGLARLDANSRALSRRPKSARAVTITSCPSGWRGHGADS